MRDSASGEFVISNSGVGLEKYQIPRCLTVLTRKAMRLRMPSMSYAVFCWLFLQPGFE
jgi:hypothetical protein